MKTNMLSPNLHRALFASNTWLEVLNTIPNAPLLFEWSWVGAAHNSVDFAILQTLSTSPKYFRCQAGIFFHRVWDRM